VSNEQETPMSETIRFTFNDTEEIGLPPDESRLPAMPELDQERAVAAEIAVERGIATPEQEEYVEQLHTDRPLLVETGDQSQYEAGREQYDRAGRAAREKGSGTVGSCVENDQEAELLGNEDGTFTQCHSIEEEA
jgi:hypothetical protein